MGNHHRYYQIFFRLSKKSVICLPCFIITLGHIDVSLCYRVICNMNGLLLLGFYLATNISLCFKINLNIFYFHCHHSETTNKVGGHLSLSHLCLIVELVKIKAFMED